MNIRDGYNSKKSSYICFKANGEDKQVITTIKATIRIDTGQIVVIGECHLGVELSMDRIIVEGHNMLIIIEMTLG